MSVDKEFKKQKFSNRELEELLDEDYDEEYEPEELDEESKKYIDDDEE